MESEENGRQELIKDILPGGIAGIDLSCSRLLFFSKGLCALLGYTREELAAREKSGEYSSLLRTEDRATYRQTIEAQIKEKGRSELCFRFLKKDGAPIWVKQYASPAKSKSNGRYYLCQIIDYTETNNALEEAEKAKTKLETLINSISAGVVRLYAAADISIDYANATFYRMTGYTEKEFSENNIQNKYCSIIHPQDRQMLREKIRGYANTEACNSFPSFDYRIITKSGETRWMRSAFSKTEGGTEKYAMIQCIISDITDEKRITKRAAISEERYRIITEQTQEIVYDWDIETDCLHHSHVYSQIFGYSLPENYPMDTLMTADIIHQDDKEELAKALHMLLNGTPYAETKYRIRKSDGSYIWCRNRMTTIFDENHQPAYVVGVLTNIDTEKKETEALLKRARQDSLTGLLNRKTVQEQIHRCLEGSTPNKRHAFFLIDVDNFKCINDSMGHIAGDTILTETSKRLCKQFTGKSITGRLGGDEFAVFMEEAVSIDDVRKKAEQLNTIYRKPFLLDGKNCTISISIGIALYPDDGMSFIELYRHADIALYRSKENGRDCFSFYAPDEPQA